jgi:TetR/AcrR family transcriptional regulator, transcriptional repressor of bet genes
VPGRKVAEVERREQLLRATYRVACRGGLDGVTARAVAEEATVSPGLVFFHFGSKDALITEMMRWLLGQVLVVLPPEGPEPASALEELQRLVADQLSRIPDQRDTVELLLAGWFVGRQPELRAVIGEAFESYRAGFLPTCRRVVDEATLAGAAVIGAGALVDAVLALIQGAAFTALRAPESFDPGALSATVTLLVHGAVAPERPQA